MDTEFINAPKWIENIFDIVENSKNIRTFAEKYLISKDGAIPLEYLRLQYKNNKEFTLDLIAEFALRGFCFKSLKENRILPNVVIPKEDNKIIVLENKNSYEKINFEKLGYGNMRSRFKIETDFFFNNIPIYGFKYINPNGNYAMLFNILREQKNFQILPLYREDKNEHDLIGKYFDLPHFKSLYEYCEKNKILYMEQITDQHISLFSRTRGVGRKKTNELSIIVKRFRKTIEKEDTSNRSAVNSDNDVKISDAFSVSSFTLFRRICKEYGIKYLKDLSDINIEVFLAAEKGFGKRRIRMIKEELSKYSLNENNEKKDKLSPKMSVIEEKLIHENDYSRLQIVLASDYFFDLPDTSFIEKLKDEYGIIKMIDLIDFSIDEVLGCLDDIGSYSKWKINLKLTDFRERFSYKGKFILISSIFNKIEYSAFVKACHSEGLFDLRDLNTVTLGALLKNFQTRKEEILGIYFQACESYKISILKIPRYRIPSFDVFCQRYLNKKTLEKIATEKELTRERIRQIEKKAFEAFALYFEVVDDYIIQKISQQSNAGGQPFVFDLDRIIEFSKGVDHTFPLIFKNAIKEGCSKQIKYVSEMDKFVVNIEPEKIYNRINGLLNKIVVNEVFNIADHDIRELLDQFNLSFLSPEDFESFISYNNNWKRYGDFFTRGNLTLKKIFSIILPEYKGGVSIDQKGIDSLKKRISEEFGEDIKLCTDRGIEGFISKEFVLAGKRRYIDPKNIYIDNTLLLEIKKYVDNTLKSGICIQLEKMYDIFREKLSLGSNITNQYMMYGVFQFYFPDEYYYKKTIRKKESEGVLMSSILEEYILEADEIVNKNSIIEHLNMRDFMVTNYVAWNKKILHWGQFGYFLHVNNYFKKSSLDVLNNFKESLRQSIEKTFLKNRSLLPEYSGYANSYQIFKDNKINFLEKGIPNEYSLFSLIEYFFGEVFYCSRPHIMDKKPESGISFEILFMTFAKNNRVFSYNCFAKFIEQLGKKNSAGNMYNFFGNQKDNIIEVAQGEYTLKENIFLSKDDTHKISDFLNRKLRDNKVFPMLSIDDYKCLPDINFSWNAYLLRSVVEEYLDDFQIIRKSSEDWRFSSPILTKKELQLATLSETIIYIIENQYRGSHSTEELEEFLITNKYVYRALPKEFLECEKLSIDEYGCFEILK